MSALSSDKIDEYEYVVGGELAFYGNIKDGYITLEKAEEIQKN